MARREPMTTERHHQTAQLLFDLRRRAAVVTRHLGRRVPAPVVDAALAVERQLALLTLRLSDAAGDHGVAGAYQLEVPEPEAAPRPPTQRLVVDEHRSLGAELYRLRGRVQALVVDLRPHFPKSSPVGRVLLKPERAVDRLRCRLDGLLRAQHRAAFDTRVYYPGHTWAGGPAAEPPPALPARPVGEEIRRRQPSFDPIA